MTYVVEWNARKYELDPTEYTQLELREVKKRTGLSFAGLVQGVMDIDPDTIGALFWLNEWRQDPTVKFSDYEGPTLREVLPHLAGLGNAINDAIPAQGKGPDATPGSPPSPSGSDTPPPSSTS